MLYDLFEVFNDYNENNIFDKVNCSDVIRDFYDVDLDLCLEKNLWGGYNEIWWDFDNDGVYDGFDGKYNGLLCSEVVFNVG